MDKVLFLDFETQGDDTKSTNATEVGAFQTEHVSPPMDLDNPPASIFRPEIEFSSLIYDKTYPPQTQFIKDLTGITDEMLMKEGRSPVLIFSEISNLVGGVDWVIAHKAAFDRGIYEAGCIRTDTPIQEPKRGWICSLTDIPYHPKYTCKKLSHLAYEHGILVDPATLHRALDDVKLLCMLVGKYRLEDIIEYRSIPWVYIRAKIPAPWEDNGVGKAQAQKLGYSWKTAKGMDTPVFDGCWVKRVKENTLQAEKEAAPFPVTRLTTT